MIDLHSLLAPELNEVDRPSMQRTTTIDDRKATALAEDT